MFPNVKVGEVSGTGSTVLVNLGWQPDYIETINLTDKDQMYKFHSGMSAGTAIDINKSGSIAELASEGFTLVNNATDNVCGFKIGTTISESSKRIAYLAVRNGPGN